MRLIWDGSRIRVVLDTSVLVAAFRSDQGASYQIMRFALSGGFILLATPALFLEYEDVLSRPEQIKVHGFSLREVGRMMKNLAEIIEPVQVRFQWRPQLRDANDELVFEAAMNGRADVLVTHNIRDFELVRDRFALQLLRPADFLKELSL